MTTPPKSQGSLHVHQTDPAGSSAPASFSGRLWTTQELGQLRGDGASANLIDTWPFQSYVQIREIACRPDFPCYFAAKAFDSGGQRFLFCDSADTLESLEQIARHTIEYLEIVGGKSGWDALATIMFIVFKPLQPHAALDEYHRQGWKVLEFLHRHDPKPWPAEIPTDIEDPAWTFCYNGVSLFVNLSSPAHVNRRSRNVGDSFALILQPRAGFDEVAGNNPKGKQVRRTIRARIGRYDTIGPSPALGSYGDGATLEWKQYALLDHNESSDAKCPLRNLFPARGKK